MIDQTLDGDSTYLFVVKHLCFIEELGLLRPKQYLNLLPTLILLPLDLLSNPNVEDLL
jgi:hypothetical protein